MPETGYFAVFLIGLLGGTHCIGMCGGIVSALTVQTVRLPGEKRRDWPLQDPKGQPPEVVRTIRDDVRERVRALLAERGWTRATNA